MDPIRRPLLAWVVGNAKFDALRPMSFAVAGGLPS
jgi:hypothetical protein